MKLFHTILCGVALALSATSCTDEIEDGTSDIDSWPSKTNEIVIPTEFTHPGVVFDKNDIERWRTIVQNHVQPQYGGYEVLMNDALSKSDYQLNGPYNEIYSGEGDGRPNITTCLAYDWGAACQNAIMFVVTKQKAHGDKALEIIRAYSKLNKPAFHAGGGGQLDHILLVSNLGAKLVYAIELMRYAEDTPMTDTDFQNACQMLRTCFAPTLEAFFNITDPSKMANGNFGAAAMNCYMSMGIVLDSVEMYEFAVNRFLYGYDNGSIRYYIDEEYGQCQETGRDQTHCQLGLGMLSMVCENAWKHGTDLYGALDNRLLLGYEYTASYNLGNEMPFKFMPELTGKYHWTEPDQVDKNEVLTGQRTESRRGKFAPVYERVYNHYHYRMGLETPYIEQVIMSKNRPEGNGAPDTAHLGFGTFLYCTEGFDQH